MLCVDGRSKALSSFPQTRRPLTAGMRRILLLAGGLVFLAGFQLFVLTEQTEHYFAWTIQPHITAAFLGAAYWASFALQVLASREKWWDRTRIAIPTILIFTVMTLAATFLHIDRFHFNSLEPIARFAAWFWLAIYVLVPPLMLVLLYRQLSVPGEDQPRVRNLPVWLRGLLGIHSIILLGVGASLFLAPQIANVVWPWKLTPLTARAVAAWLIGLGIGAGQGVYENEFARLRVAMISYTLFGLLEFLTLLRYWTSIEWMAIQSWLYVGFLATVLVVGVSGWRARVGQRNNG